MAKAKQQVQDLQAPSTTQPAQPPAAPQAAVPSVEPKKMDGVTAENFTTYTKEQLIAGYGNKSNAIRGLAALGVKAGPIAKQLDIIYQHARNVLKRPLKRVIKEQRDAAQGNTTQEQ
jgi:hypothetical protein